MLKTQIMAGSTFADVLARYPQTFGYIFIGLVKAGEEAGELEKTLGRIKDLLTKQQNIKTRVIGTLMYPFFVIILAIIIILIMLVFVFPAFKAMFEQQERKLPWITQMMIDAGDFLKEYWYTLPIFAIAFFALGYIFIHWKPTREFLDRTILKIPLLNNLIMYANYSNFMSVLSVSYDAGIPVVDCLNLGVITITNTILHKKVAKSVIRECKEELSIDVNVSTSQGLQISQALKATKVMPKMLLFMIATGEQSGRLGDMLEKAVNFLDKTLDGVIDTITKMIEPIMLLVIGSIVLVMALALYLPLFQSYMQT